MQPAAPPARQGRVETAATPTAARSTTASLARNLGSTGAQIDVPSGWTLRANGAGFFLDDEAGTNRLVIRAEATHDNVFDRLPRSGPRTEVTERALDSGARYYRRSDDEGVAIFVDLPIGDGRSLVCACEPELERVCTSLRAAVPSD